MSALCPHCGYDLQRDAAIELGDARFAWGEGLRWRGAAIALSPQQRAIVQALLKARGQLVSHEALIARMGSDADDLATLLRKQVHQLRTVIRRAGGPDPIRNERGLGYRWAG